MAECITPCVSINISDVTEGTLEGNGSFDVLMQATREHLKREHDANRITGDQFAQVYIAGMQAAMSNATQFALQKEMVSYQIQSLIEQLGLTAEQLELIKAQTAQVQAQTLNVPKQGELLDGQVLQVNAQTTQVEAQTLNIPKQGALIDEQVLTQGNTTLVEAERVNTQTEQTAQVKTQSELISVQSEVLSETRNYQPMR